MAGAFLDQLMSRIRKPVSPVVAQNIAVPSSNVYPMKPRPQYQGSNDVENTFIRLMREANFPVQVGMGQYAAEGRDKGMGASRNNYMNIGAFDGQENKMPSYATPEEGFQQYLKLIETRYPDAWNSRDNPEQMIKLIEQGNYAGDPATYSKRAANNYKSYSDFIKATPEWRKYGK